MANIDELKSTGLKATLPRLKILDVFQKGAQRHMTAEDVFRVLLEERSDIGLATVYRVLTQFEQAGILSRSHFESGKAVYELNEGTHHDHMVCLDCGRVEEFYDAEIEKRQHAVAEAKGFAIADHALSLYAHCTKNPCPNRPEGIRQPPGRASQLRSLRAWPAIHAQPCDLRDQRRADGRYLSCSIARRWRSTNSW